MGEQALQLLVLNYHHVHEEASIGFSVSPSTLMDQLRLLLDLGFAPLSLSGLITLMTKAHSHGNHLLVTFDDGYDDFATHALPVLERLGIPALLFVISDLIGRWNDWDPLRRSRRRHLTLDELGDLRSHDVEFGAHSRTHRVLTTLARRDLESEIAGSKAILESALRVPIRAFAYPGGHMNRRVMEVTARSYELAFCAAPMGPVKEFHPFRISRFDPFLHTDLNHFKRALAPMLIPLSPAIARPARGLGWLYGLFQRGETHG